jgi:hypothetical protein
MDVGSVDGVPEVHTTSIFSVEMNGVYECYVKQTHWRGEWIFAATYIPCCSAQSTFVVGEQFDGLLLESTSY